MDKRIELVLLHGCFFSPVLHSAAKKFGYSKIRVRFSKTDPETLKH